jgi:hypothetical protein
MNPFPETFGRSFWPKSLMSSQQVPEMELNYVNSSPEDISDFGQKDLPNVSGNGFIPTIHIPDNFDSLHSKMDESSEISINALFSSVGHFQ